MRALAGVGERVTATFGDPRLPTRFWAKVSPEPNSGCWLWVAGTWDGYGRFNVGSRTDRSARVVQAHILAYEELVDSVPDGLELDHLCRVRCCVNPSHLEPVTHAENMRRGEAGRVGAARQRAKTHCPKGHPYDEANTRITFAVGFGRQCRACDRDLHRRLRAERRAAR